MKARPNPWIAVPALTFGLLVGYIGWVVTEASCRLEGSVAISAGCPVTSLLVAVGGFLGATVGIAIVLSLVYRSVAEYRERKEEPHP